MTNKLRNTRNMGFIAHIDAGKTSVSECVLFYTGRTHKAGNIDDGNTVLDWMVQEKERGVTIVSAATSCQWNGFDINIIDTPGHVDFTAEVERSLRVLDGAIVVLDSVAGVQPQSETVWRQANKYNVPRMVFINKMDKIGADFDKATQTLIDRLSANPVPIQIPIGTEDKFEGIIDLVEQKAIYYKIGDEIGHIDKTTDIPEDLKAKAEEYRSNLIEKVAENDEEFLDIIFSGDEFENEKNYPHRSYDYFRIYHLAKNIPYDSGLVSQLMLNDKLPFLNVWASCPYLWDAFGGETGKIDARFNVRAMHMNAGLVGEFLKRKVLEHPRVNFIEGKVVDGIINEDGTLAKDVGNQISYTLKYVPDVVDYKHFRDMMRKHQSKVRACSVMPQTNISAYEYQPEEAITKVKFEDISRSIAKAMAEDIGREHVDCGTPGGCPIDFDEEQKQWELEEEAEIKLKVV